jgi:membrane-bound metal-dependent hydrolase YbcI (DUF457 family)
MFIGHLGVAFGLKRVAPEVNLGVAVAAASALDIVWPLLVVAGVEVVRIDTGNTRLMPLEFVSYPFSHSFVTTFIWAALFGAGFRFFGGSRRGALWLAAAVASHWFLDLLVHGPDLALAPGVDVRVGLGLWNSIAGTLLVEGFVFVAGVWAYLSVTARRDRTGVVALWGLVTLVVVVYAGSLFGPPPPDVNAIVIADLLGTALTIASVVWIERHRAVQFVAQTLPVPEGRNPGAAE